MQDKDYSDSSKLDKENKRGYFELQNDAHWGRVGNIPQFH